MYANVAVINDTELLALILSRKRFVSYALHENQRDLIQKKKLMLVLIVKTALIGGGGSRIALSLECMNVSVYVCVYICIYIYIHTHTHLGLPG